jgi:hypothetical protein
MPDNDDVLQAMYDRECAPVIGYCKCCGGEIYDSVWRKPWEGLCAVCLEEAKWEEDEDDQTA